MQGPQVRCEKCFRSILEVFTSVLERFMGNNYDSDRNTSSVFVSNSAMIDFQLFLVVLEIKRSCGRLWSQKRIQYDCTHFGADQGALILKREPKQPPPPRRR